MSSYVESTLSYPVATTATATTQATAGRRVVSGGHPPAAFQTDPSMLIPEYDGSVSSFPRIDWYECAECGTRQYPGAGAGRQSTAETAQGLRRGGKCRSCKRACRAIMAAFNAGYTRASAELATEPAGDRAARQRQATLAARVVAWQVVCEIALRQAKRQARAAEVVRS